VLAFEPLSAAGFAVDDAQSPSRGTPLHLWHNDPNNGNQSFYIVLDQRTIGQREVSNHNLAVFLSDLQKQVTHRGGRAH
jgi:hypothetical protein